LFRARSTNEHELTYHFSGLAGPFCTVISLYISDHTLIWLPLYDEKNLLKSIPSSPEHP
jgi:hypothetical protein